MYELKVQVTSDITFLLIVMQINFMIPKAEKKFMQLAIKEAIMAKKKGDYAIGAVIVKGDRVLAKAGNRIKLDIDPT